MLTADAKEEKRRSEQKDGCNADAAARLRVTNPSASLAHHPCICACLTAVLGPHKLPRGEHQCATPDGHDLRSVSPQEASTDEETEDDEGRFEGIRVSREDQKLVEERYGSGTEEGHPRARREVAGAHRAAERARLERLCLELARLEARLQDVVTRGRAARPRTEGYDARPWSSSYESRPRNPSYKSRPRTASYESRPRTASDESEGSPQFEDKRTIFERAAPARRAPLPEDYKSRPRNARAHAPGAQNEPHWGKSEAAGLARGAYEAARLCRLGVKPCAYRRRNSAGGEGREALRCCDGCGSTSEEPTWATCADVGRGKGGEELVRLKR